jgi:hypothetical protein
MGELLIQVHDLHGVQVMVVAVGALFQLPEKLETFRRACLLMDKESVAHAALGRIQKFHLFGAPLQSESEAVSAFDQDRASLQVVVDVAFTHDFVGVAPDPCAVL